MTTQGGRGDPGSRAVEETLNGSARLSDTTLATIPEGLRHGKGTQDGYQELRPQAGGTPLAGGLKSGFAGGWACPGPGGEWEVDSPGEGIAGRGLAWGLANRT